MKSPFVTITKHDPPSNWFTRFKWPMLVGLFAFVINLDTIRYDFTFDDPLVLVNNNFVHEGVNAIPKIFSTVNLEGVNGEKESNYRPLSISQFAIEYELFGKNPGGYHFFQVLYYSIVCGLVTLLLLLLFKQLPSWVPISMALIYAVHPLHVEVVANIKSRDEIMGLLGIIATLILVLKTSKTKYDGIYLILAACVAFFSKESALPLVLVGPITFYFFRSTSIADLIKSSWPIWVAAALYLFMRQVIVETPGPDFKLEENALFAFEGPERWFAAMALIAHYVQLLIAPVTLRADYSFDQLQLKGWGDPWSYLGTLITLTVIYIMLIGLKKRSIYSFALFFSAMFYIVTANLFVMTGATLAERFMFIPSLGMIIILIYLLYERVAPLVSTTVLYSILGLLVLGYSIRTIVRNRDWKDNETIYRVTAMDCQHSIRAQTKLARFMYNDANLPIHASTKSKLLSDGLSIVDRSIKIYEPYPLSHYVRGLILKEQSRYQEAIQTLHRGLQLNPTSSTYSVQAGLCYGYLGQDSLALIEFKIAEAKGSKSPITYHELARLYYNQGQYKVSLGYYIEVLSINPNDVKALTQITKIYRDKLNDMPNARKYNDRLLKASVRK